MLHILSAIRWLICCLLACIAIFLPFFVLAGLVDPTHYMPLAALIAFGGALWLGNHWWRKGFLDFKRHPFSRKPYMKGLIITLRVFGVVFLLLCLAMWWAAPAGASIMSYLPLPIAFVVLPEIISFINLAADKYLPQKAADH